MRYDISEKKNQYILKEQDYHRGDNVMLFENEILHRYLFLWDTLSDKNLERRTKSWNNW